MAGFTGLTSEIAEQAIDMVEPSISIGMFGRGCALPWFSQEAGYLVILNPTKPYEPRFKDWGQAFRRDIVLATREYGARGEWPGQFHEVALAKAYASWKTGLPSHCLQQEAPYLYQEAWTKWGGSAVGPGGLVVAFSGVQWWYDQMIAEMTIAAIKAICLDRMHRPGGVMADSFAFLTVGQPPTNRDPHEEIDI